MYEVFQSVGRSTGGWAPHASPAVALQRAVRLFARVSEVDAGGVGRELDRTDLFADRNVGAVEFTTLVASARRMG